jgi:ech hydrogenase subunit D
MSEEAPKSVGPQAAETKQSLARAIDPQRIEEIPLQSLLERAQGMRAEGWRLAQACCTRLVADQEADYSFDREGALLTLRVRLPIRDAELPSISRFFPAAALYENEMHDLFGVSVKGMAVDYHGHLFTTMVPTPYVTRDSEHGE